MSTPSAGMATRATATDERLRPMNGSPRTTRRERTILKVGSVVLGLCLVAVVVMVSERPERFAPDHGSGVVPAGDAALFLCLVKTVEQNPYYFGDVSDGFEIVELDVDKNGELDAADILTPSGRTRVWEEEGGDLRIDTFRGSRSGPQLVCRK